MPGLLHALGKAVGEDHCLTRPDELAVYECDGLTCHRAQPRAVVFPDSREQVQQIVRACRSFDMPFVPRGAGTGLSGGALAADAVVIECSRMNRILGVDAFDRIVRVEPGVVNAEISRRVAPLGLHYAPDPSSQLVCTIGGNVAENAGGPHTLKHGTTTNHVLALDLVLPDGEFVQLGSATGWSTSGYDLVGAVVGGEGTLGVVTAATLRLVPLPERVETLLGIFPDVVSACRAVGGIIGSGLVPAALEIIDQRTIAAVEASVYAAGLPTDAGAVLIIELDGPEIALPAQVVHVRDIVNRNGATAVEVAQDEAERARFWRARKGAFGAMGRLGPDLYVHDAVVPRGRLPEVLAEVCAIGDRHGLTLSNVFHAGDGNLHPNISFDRRDPDELARVLSAGAEILELCVRVGGVITGEHGIGNEKRDFMPLLFDAADLEAMMHLRAAFDPDRVCNPDKIFPSTRFCMEANPNARGYERVPFG